MAGRGIYGDNANGSSSTCQHPLAPPASKKVRHKFTTSPNTVGQPDKPKNPSIEILQSTSCCSCPSLLSSVLGRSRPGLTPRHAVVFALSALDCTTTCVRIGEPLIGGVWWRSYHDGTYAPGLRRVPYLCAHVSAALRPLRELWRGQPLRTRPWPAPLARRPGTWRRPP